MSGVAKSVGKAFRKVVKSPVFKIVAIAAAVYFTAGLASGAFAAVPAVGAEAAALGGAAAAEAAGGIGIGLEAGVGSAAMAATGAGGLTAAEFSMSALAAAEAGESISFAAAISESVGTNMATAAEVAGKLGSFGGEFLSSEEALLQGASAMGDVANAEIAQIAQAGTQAGSGIADAATNVANAAEPPMFTPEPAPTMQPQQIAQTMQQPLTPQPQSVTTPVSQPAPQYTPPTAEPVTGQAPGSPDMKLGSSVADGGPGSTNVAEKGLMDKSLDWFNGLPTPVQKIVSQGLGNMASEGLKAIALNSQQNAAEKAKEQARQDVIRRSGVPYMWGSQATQPANVAAYKTPGIINAAGA